MDKMNIPLVDLTAQRRRIVQDHAKKEMNLEQEIKNAMQHVINDNAFIGHNNYIKNFESNFSAALNNGIETIGVSSGTTALHVAAKALDLQPGDEIITVPNTFIATIETFDQMGLNIKFVDVGEDYNMDISKLSEALTEKTKLIIPVHLYGLPADMDPIMNFAKQNGLYVIEDAAQAHLAEYNGKKAGTLGDLATFSFFPGKNLGAWGDAGAVVTKDKQLETKVRSLINHGRKSKYEHDEIGFNYRMDPIQAAVLDTKLRHLPQWTEERRAIAEIYSALLDPDKIIFPTAEKGFKHAYHLYVIRFENGRDNREIQLELNKKGIGAGIHYPVPLHLQPAYNHLGLGEGSFPNAEKFSKEVISLPMFPELTISQIKYITDTVNELAQQSH